MNKNWNYIWIAACFEVCWVIGIKHSSTLLEWLGTAVAIFVSFYLMILASKEIDVGTVYAVFVGLGTVGTVITGILLFNEEAKLIKLLLIGILLVGVVSLKLQAKPKTTTQSGVMTNELD